MAMIYCASSECVYDAASTVAPSRSNSLNSLDDSDTRSIGSMSSEDTTSVSQNHSLLPVHQVVFMPAVFVPVLCQWAGPAPECSSVTPADVENDTNSEWPSDTSTQKERSARNMRWCAKKQRSFPVHSMPAASKEEWQTRGSKRQAAIDLVKRSEEYRRCVASGRQLPPVPDASDSSISKRSWEAELMKFRHAAKALAKTLGSPAPSVTGAAKGLQPRWADMVDSDDEDE